jgi:Tfp pilus assembly protein PilF
LVYLKKKQFKEAEALLAESVRKKDFFQARAALALAYLSQGKVAEAGKTHLEGIELKPKASERYETYAAFLSDVGREAESEAMIKRAKELRGIH